MRKLEQYRIQDGKTPLNAEELNKRILDIDGRLHVLEEMKISWEAAVADVQNHGLERINNTVQPVLDAASDLVAEAQDEIDAIKFQWQDVLAGWNDVVGQLDAMQAGITAMQAEIDAAHTVMESYTDTVVNEAVYYAAHSITEWAASDDDHPFTNFENASARGKATIKLPADSEAWVLGSFPAMVTGADIGVVIRHMMSAADTDPVNWGLAYAVGDQDLCAVPWQPGAAYAEGDRVCPPIPNGCWYYVDTGNAGTSGSSGPSFPIIQGQTAVDNGVTWTCGGTDNFDTISLTGETVPASAWMESTKIFTIPGTGITAEDIVRLLVIRAPGSPEHSGDLHLISATHKAADT